MASGVRSPTPRVPSGMLQAPVRRKLLRRASRRSCAVPATILAYRYLGFPPVAVYLDCHPPHPPKFAPTRQLCQPGAHNLYCRTVIWIVAIQHVDCVFVMQPRIEVAPGDLGVIIAASFCTSILLQHGNGLANMDVRLCAGPNRLVARGVRRGRSTVLPLRRPMPPVPCTAAGGGLFSLPARFARAIPPPEEHQQQRAQQHRGDQEPLLLGSTRSKLSILQN